MYRTKLDGTKVELKVCPYCNGKGKVGSNNSTKCGNSNYVGYIDADEKIMVCQWRTFKS